MPTIKVNQAHNKPLPEVRDLANDIASKLKASYEVSSRWQNDNRLIFKRPGLNGDLNITASNVIIELDLSFLLANFKFVIEQRIREQLEKKLA